MNQFLPFLLLGVGLLTAACGKDAPEPEPDLRGRWNGESTTRYTVDAAGQVKDKSTVPDNSFTVQITGDSLIYDGTTGAGLRKSYKYVRQGNDLDFTRFRCTITVLTAHALTLRFEERNPAPTTPRAVVEDNYVR
jgi:hypothetical protein